MQAEQSTPPPHDLTSEVFGILPFDDSTPTAELLDSVQHAGAWKSHLAWATYARASAIHERTATHAETADRRLLDDFTHTSARIAAVLQLSKYAADTLLRNALAMRRRIPRIGACLRDGLITDHHFQYLVTHTDLIDGEPYADDVDIAISTELRREGTWSTPRLRDLADKMIFRHDPDAVRRRHDRAVRDRTCANSRLREGMGRIAITATAEETALAIAAVDAVSKSVCPHDPRTKNARRSDAAISRLKGAPFNCQCDRDDCTATAAEHPLSDRNAQVVIHLIATSGTLYGGDPDSPGGDGPDDSCPGGGPDGGGPDGGSPDDGWGREDTWIHPSPQGHATTTEPDHWPGHTADDYPPDDDRADNNRADDINGHYRHNTSARSSDEDQTPATRDPTTAELDDSDPPPPKLDPTDPDYADTHITHHRDGTGLSNQPGFLDGYGIISAHHVRVIAARPSTIIRPINPRPGMPLPSSLPSDGYRFSAALDTYIRARDGYCTFTGCTAPAWSCDIDHTTEYDHHNPEAGGQTTRGNSKTGCRLHHLIKTFGNWLDDQYTDRDGRTHIEIRTPEGFIIESRAHTNEALFPQLRHLQFRPPSAARPRTAGARTTVPAEPQRDRTRTAAKHARRRHERELNRRQRARGVSD